QPYLSHDFPANTLELQTTVTPDLLDPVSHPEVLFDAPGVTSDILVFWPMTIAKDGHKTDVNFRWTVNGEPTPVVSNLFFMSSAALSLELVMRAVADGYRRLAKPNVATTEDPDTWPDRRTARVGGVRRTYAPTDGDEGKTAFTTDKWLLSYRGRLMSAL